MQQALLVRLRPLGPWRYGPSDGARDRVDTLYRSDRLFSAITLAMRQLGCLDSWLDATARNEKPAVAFSSLFPFQGDALYVTPPANLWPPPSSLVTSPSPVFLTKVRWRAAHFVPLSLVDSLLTGQSILADQWIPDTESGCLLRRDRPSSSPFRIVSRSVAPVDRLRLTAADSEPSACVEFESGSGLWSAIRFLDDAAHAAWNDPLRAAFRLLADSGFGGGRSKGWGQVQTPEFETGNWPALILPKVGRLAKNDSHEEQTSRSYWLLSLYSPASQDAVNWSGGQYELAVRNGRVEGATGALKKSIRMVTEGCILDAASEPLGTAVDVAPAGFAHPVYRSGIALSLLLPPPRPQSEDRRAIEEIVPPELEATPFPIPVVEEPADKSLPSEGVEEEPAAPEPMDTLSESESTPVAELPREESAPPSDSSPAIAAIEDPSEEEVPPSIKETPIQEIAGEEPAPASEPSEPPAEHSASTDAPNPPIHEPEPDSEPAPPSDPSPDSGRVEDPSEEEEPTPIKDPEPKPNEEPSGYEL